MGKWIAGVLCVLLSVSPVLPAVPEAGLAADELLKQIDGAIAKDDYLEASRLASVLESRGRRDTSPVAFILAKAFEARITSLRAEYVSVRMAKERLAKDRRDAAAKRTIGLFYCLHKQDWSSGLPLLREGDDAKLAETADWELADPPDAARRVALGDRWWALASVDHTKDRPPKTERAVFWYSKAYAGLEGDEKKRAGSRIATETAATLDKSGGKSVSPIDLYHHLKFSELDVALGLRFGRINPSRKELTYFHLDSQIDNESSRGRVDNLTVIVRALCVDADGKPNVTELRKQLPLDSRGIQTVDVAAVIYSSVIRHRNNNQEVPRNAYAAFSVGDEVIHEVFLAPPTGNAWWLDSALVEH